MWTIYSLGGDAAIPTAQGSRLAAIFKWTQEAACCDNTPLPSPGGTLSLSPSIYDSLQTACPEED